MRSSSALLFTDLFICLLVVLIVIQSVQIDTNDVNALSGGGDGDSVVEFSVAIFMDANGVIHLNRADGVTIAPDDLAARLASMPEGKILTVLHEEADWHSIKRVIGIIERDAQREVLFQ